MKLSPSFSAWLNTFRWTAALLVVVSHIRDLLFVEYSAVEQKSIWLQPFYFITGFSHEAVMIFFVISGFLVGGLSTQKFLSGRFDPADFVIHRFSRIYIVLLPALLATFLLDSLGGAYFDKSGIYSNTIVHEYEVIFANELSWANLLGCLFMMQGILVQGLGTNGPLWSLAYEWWYYTMFFLAIGALSPSFTRRRRLFCAVALFAVAAALPVKLMLWFLVWLVGLSIALIVPRVPRIPAIVGWLVFLGTLLACRLDHVYVKSPTMAHDLMRDLILAVACTVLFCALARQENAKVKGAAFHGHMAEFSYTTYMVHFPFLILAVAFSHDVLGIPLHKQPSPERFAYYFALLSCIYVYSYVFSLATERHTQSLRRMLGNWSGRAVAYGT
ncbi:MAG: O-antigen acetylase [Paucimonas sp.]|jgi:peptidoglycan/LPS O-acetylase OafA/YrhL|nr:O-antigen acetylase [Paucimonas sp.]